MQKQTITIEELKKAWEKAKGKRNGGASGLSAVIDSFEKFVQSLK